MTWPSRRPRKDSSQCGGKTERVFLTHLWSFCSSILHGYCQLCTDSQNYARAMHASFGGGKGCLQSLQRAEGKPGKRKSSESTRLPRLLSGKELPCIEVWISSKWLRGTEFISTLFWILVHLWDFHWLELILEIYAFFSLTYRNSDSSGLIGAFRNPHLLKSYCRYFVSLQNVQWTLIQAHWCMAKPWGLLSIQHGLVTSVDPRWLTETLVIYFKVFSRAFSLYWKWD